MNLPAIPVLFEQLGIETVVHDMGRRIQRLSPQVFRQFEAGQQPWPWPLQQHAWLAIIGWHEDDRDKHFIWFVRLPLDELGQLDPVVRDEWRQNILSLLSAGKAGHDNGIEPAFGFTPKEESMAAFHARAEQLLHQPVSAYYSQVQDYLAGKPGYDNWQQLGMQGLAEVAARLDEGNNQQIVMHAIPLLPLPPFAQLCRFLEHQPIDDALATCLISRADDSASVDPLVAVIRGISGMNHSSLHGKFIFQWLNGPHGNNIEVLAAISGRSWELLTHKDIARAWLTALSQNDQGQHGFDHLLADVLAIPGIRTPLMDVMREPERDDSLARAMAQFFRGVRH